jgi:hypothetical protein
MKRMLVVGLLSFIGLWGSFHEDIAFAKKKPKKSEKKSGSSGKGRGKNKGGEYQPPYGMAGCGWGSVLVSEDAMFPQLFAVIVNGISANQLSAISCTGSSNCAATKEDLATMEQEVFMTANLNSLEKDVARGGGDYLFAWSEVLGCSDVYKIFTKESNSHYLEIFADLKPNDVLARYIKVIRSHEHLGTSCQRVALTRTS